MWWRRMRFTLGYMSVQVMLKGMLSGALWVMYWFVVETAHPGIGTYFTALFAGLFGVAFGAFIGLVTGLVVGAAYVIANGVFLRADMDLHFYRYALMAIGGLLSLLSWGPFWLGVTGDDIWIPLSGGLLAAAGVAFSAYAYLPEYVERVVYGRLYDPYDENWQPRPDGRTAFT